MHIAGSMVELGDDGRAYNTGFIFNSQGELIHIHRKIHLYDVDIPGGITFFESDFFGAGDSYGAVQTELGGLGMVVCHDLRFCELFRPQVLAGAELIIVPAAFNKTSGPAHWEILIRTRAMENTVYLAACGGAPHPEVGYPYYGHSSLVDPYGNIVAQAKGDQEEIVFSEFRPQEAGGGQDGPARAQAAAARCLCPALDRAGAAKEVATAIGPVCLRYNWKLSQK